MTFETMNDTSYRQEGGAVILHVSAKNDSVVSPITRKAHISAVFLYQRVKGDLVLQAKMFRRFLSTYNVPILMAMESETRWVEAYPEYTDPHTRAVVSVITDTTLDDCNGVKADSDSIWLQLCRKDRIFATHYSLDGVHWRMHRILRMKTEEELKVGLVAQSPLGYGGDFIFEKVSLKPGRKADIRGGNWFHAERLSTAGRT